MLFGLKKLPFVSTFHSLRRGLTPEANVAAIGRPKTAYLDVEKIIKKLTDLIHFYVIWQLKCMATFVSQEIWEQGSAFFSRIFWITFR